MWVFVLVRKNWKLRRQQHIHCGKATQAKRSCVNFQTVGVPVAMAARMLMALIVSSVLDAGRIVLC